MKDKQAIVSNWLPRYTGTPLDGFDRTKIPTMPWPAQDALYGQRLYG